MLDSVFITGGSRGIGEAMVRLFAEKGFRVAFTYVNSKENAFKIAEETGAHPVFCDISSQDSVIKAVTEARNKVGAISVLVNNAGISKNMLFCDTTATDWREIQGVNSDGLYYVTSAVLPDMISKKLGRIVNISSVWGVCGASCEVAYSTSKSACIGFTKSLAKELAPSGITVNCIAPGVVDTDMNRCYSKNDMELIISDIPVGRMAEPKEVAELCAFLASENASYITGQVIGINGGFGE